MKDLYDHIAINWLNIGYLEAITGPLKLIDIVVNSECYFLLGHIGKLWSLQCFWRKDDLSDSYFPYEDVCVKLVTFQSL